MTDRSAVSGRGGATSHPWLEALRAAPEKEVQRLFAGIADISPYHGADLPDAVTMLFAGIEADDAEALALEKGLLHWLEAHRRKGWGDERDHQVLVRRAIDAFDIIARVDLPGLTRFLWQQFPRWYNWVDQHDLAPHADLRSAFLRTLALTQDRLDPESHERRIPFWLDICGRAGRGYPDAYVDIGILGLQGIPLPPQPEGLLSNESLCVSGLLHWVSGRRQMWNGFAQRWLTLKYAFPHLDSYWRKLFRAIVYPRRRELAPEFLEAWARNIGEQGKVSRGAGQFSHQPYREQVRALIRVLPKRTGKEAIEDARRLVANLEVNAFEHGITEFVVKSACNLGQGLLRKANGSIARRAEVALDFAMTALRWEPQHTHGWSLWRDSLTALKRYGDAELVAWESIRRFPNVAVLADNLSQLWMAEGHMKRAGALLEETVRRTDDMFSRNLLAGLLLKSRQPEDRSQAEELLREGVRRDDPYSRNMLAGLLMRSRRLADRVEAEDLLRGMVERTRSRHARTMLAGLLLRRAHKKDFAEVEELLRGADYDDVSARAMLAWFLWGRNGIEDRGEAIELLRHDAQRDDVARDLLIQLLGGSAEADDVAEVRRLTQEMPDEAPDEDTVSPSIAVEFDDRTPETEGIATELASENETAPDSNGVYEPPIAAAADHRATETILNQVFRALATDASKSSDGRHPAPLRKEHLGKARARETSEEVSGAAVEARASATHREFKHSDSYLMNSIRPFGLAARSVFLMKHGEPTEKAAARKSLMTLWDDDDLPFARFLLLGVQPASEPSSQDLQSGAFGLALLAALRARSVDYVQELQTRFPQEALLCALVKARIDGEAIDRRDLAAKYLRRARLDGILVGPASLTYIQLAAATKTESVITSDNERLLMAALGSSFQMPIAA